MRLALVLILVLHTVPVTADDYAPGEKLTLFHCGRCHVISERNKYGGIGSTPSFGALRTLEDWEDRMRAFYALAPHPAFTQVEGITEPFAINRPGIIRLFSHYCFGVRSITIRRIWTHRYLTIENIESEGPEELLKRNKQ